MKNMVLIKEKGEKDIDPKFNFLRQISSNPKKVEIHDLEADNDILYPSVFTTA